MRLIQLLLLLFVFGCQKQQLISYPEYYREYNVVSELLNTGELEIAIAKFDSISSCIPHVPSNHYFKIARSCANHYRCDLAADYLRKSLENGQEYGKGIGAYTTIDLCKSEVNEVLKREEEIHRVNFNYNYKNQIDSMFEVDQKARTEYDGDKMREVDSLNMLTLLQGIEEYGYPGESIIGHASAFNAFIMLLHMDRDKNNEILKPILDKAYDSGQLGPRGYAWIIDRRRAWGSEKLEPYYYHMPSEKYDSFSKEQRQEIDRRRDSIGLGPKN